MDIKDKTIALLIDSDNISRDYYPIILEELSQYGNVTYRRLYGDFSKQKANGWEKSLLEYAIEQRQQVAFTKGKNATDSQMIIDAMDILYSGKVDCFCLATSDSDFTGLAMRFRNDNIIIIGAGEKKTPLSFRNACHRFIPIDELLKIKKEQSKDKVAPVVVDETASAKIPKQTKKTKPIKEQEEPPQKTQKNILDVAKKIIENGADTDGWMHFSAFMNELYLDDNSFDPRLYGHRNNRAASFFKELKSDGKTVFVFKKELNIDKISVN